MLGALRLPVMIRLFRIDPPAAVGSNMTIGALTALAGVATTLAADSDFPLVRMLVVLAVVGPPTVVGGWLGGWLTGWLRKDSVRVLAGWVIALTGVLMVAQAGRVWLHR
jgi:uncharacterized membrane protein YfcA